MLDLVSYIMSYMLSLYLLYIVIENLKKSTISLCDQKPKSCIKNKKKIKSNSLLLNHVKQTSFPIGLIKIENKKNRRAYKIYPLRVIKRIFIF